MSLMSENSHSIGDGRDSLEFIILTLLHLNAKFIFDGKFLCKFSLYPLHDLSRQSIPIIR